MVRVTLTVATVLLAADMWAFGRMTRKLRRLRPEMYERYFAAGTWIKYFGETDFTIWEFYKSRDGNDDPEIRSAKSLSKTLSWIAPLAWIAVVASIYFG